jgi:hypothetical protein
MSEPTEQRQRYMVGVFEPKEAGGAFLFTFVPKGLMYERGPDGPPKRLAHFAVEVRQVASGLTFDWGVTTDDPGAAREVMQADIAARLKDRAIWIERVTSLVSQVEQWAKEMQWSTRRVEKKLDDAWIGKHRVPALLMQEDTCRVLLEPVGRSALGSEGVVDLYLMPAYDDIASLYYYGNRWNLHYLFPGTRLGTAVREAEAMPVSKETLEKILTEMRQNAA